MVLVCEALKSTLHRYSPSSVSLTLKIFNRALSGPGLVSNTTRLCPKTVVSIQWLLVLEVTSETLGMWIPLRASRKKKFCLGNLSHISINTVTRYVPGQFLFHFWFLHFLSELLVLSLKWLQNRKTYTFILHFWDST